jgi:hypothetical protein
MTNASSPMGARLRPKLHEPHARPELPVTPGETPPPPPMDPDQPGPPSYDPSSPYCADDPPPLLNDERA